MIPLFYGRSSVQYSIRYSPYFANLKDMLEIDIFRLSNYYKNSSGAVNNSDFLVKLIRAINTDVKLNQFDYFTSLTNKTKYIERTSGVISNISFGRMLTLLEGDAMVLSVDLGVDYMGLEKTWEDIAPLRPFCSTTTNVSLPHPTKVTHDFTGYLLDTKLLMMMWYYYAKEHKNPQIAYFIFRYVYTNMMPYFLDHAIVNLFLGAEPMKFKNTNPIHVIDQTKKILRYTKALNKKTKAKKLFYEEVMLNLRLVKSRDMLELFTLSSPFFTRQSRHGIFFMYRDIMVNLMLYLGDRGIRRNLPVMKDLFLLTERMISSKSLTAIDYKMYKDDIEGSLQLIYEVSKNRRI